MAISPLSDPRASPGHWPLARQQNRPPCNTCHGRAFHLYRDFYIIINVHVNNPIHLILNTPFIPILWSQTCLIKFHGNAMTKPWFLEGCFINEDGTWWDYIHDIHQKSSWDLWYLGIFLGTTFCALGGPQGPRWAGKSRGFCELCWKYMCVAMCSIVSHKKDIELLEITTHLEWHLTTGLVGFVQSNHHF